VAAFLDGKLKFPEIASVVAETMARMDYKEDNDIETILAVDGMARIESAAVVLETSKKSMAAG
jgi:1-deoxy-D-xylulose-5-phosphate reductoisomerase